MGCLTGLEPALTAFTGRLLDSFGIKHHKLVPVDGVAPPLASNRLAVLLLNYTGNDGSNRTDRSDRHSAALWGLQPIRRSDFYAA